MKKLILLLLFLPVTLYAQSPYYTQEGGSLALTEQGASHFARLALKCVGQEFPNKTSHIQSAGNDLKQPSEYHPAFYGCFDWHSSVHGHWMLVRILNQFRYLPEAAAIRAALNKNLTKENILAEVDYFNEKYAKSYERTYGWAWLLKLAQELDESDDPECKRWAENLQPLTNLIVQRYIDFLPKQNYATRIGTHNNTAFGLSFALDYALASHNKPLTDMLIERSKYYFLTDTDCPAAWEPGGADFFSPCLLEAELLSKVLPAAEYNKWLANFLPDLAKGKPAGLFEAVSVSDRNDLQLVHLDGLNLSRAWCFMLIAKQLIDPALKRLLIETAISQLNATLPNIADGDYAGEHWLASFAVYALSIQQEKPAIR